MHYDVLHITFQVPNCVRRRRAISFAPFAPFATYRHDTRSRQTITIPAIGCTSHSGEEQIDTIKYKCAESSTLPLELSVWARMVSIL